MKTKLLSIIIAILAIITVSISAYAEDVSDINTGIENEFDISKFCDANNDGRVTAADARLILRISAKLEVCTEHAFKYGDTNKDEKITASDARTILRVAAQIEDINCLAIGHDYSLEKTVKATCEADGYDLYKCSLCNTTKEENIVNKIGHRYDFEKTIKASCETEGYDLEKCIHCGKTRKINITPKTTHHFEKGSIIKGTCVSDGYTEYKCSACGIIEKRDITKAGGHEYKIISREFYSQSGSNNIYKTRKQCKYCKNILNTYDINDVSNIQIEVKLLSSKEAHIIVNKFNLSKNGYIFEGYDITNSTIVVYDSLIGVDINGYYYNPNGEKMGPHDYCGKPLGLGEGMCHGLCNITWS